MNLCNRLISASDNEVCCNCYLRECCPPASVLLVQEVLQCQGGGDGRRGGHRDGARDRGRRQRDTTVAAAAADVVVFVASVVVVFVDRSI